jgi:hypothetical protein
LLMPSLNKSHLCELIYIKTMSKVFVAVGISLDGFLSGPNPDTENPIGEGGLNIFSYP